MPATACTPRPANADAGCVCAGSATRRNVSPTSVIRHALGTLHGAVRARRDQRDDRVDFVEARSGLAQRARRQPPAVAEAARGVDDDDLEIAREPVVLQSVVGDDHVALRDARRAARAPRRPDRRPTTTGNAGAREQHRLVADLARIRIGSDDDRRPRTRSLGRGRGSRCPDASRARQARA